MNPVFEYYPCQKIRVLIEPNETLKKTIDHCHNEIDAIYQKQSKIRKLYNNLLFTLTKFEISKDSHEMIIKGDFVEYKALVAKQINSHLAYSFSPLGVSGMIVLNNRVLIGRRFKDTLMYPGYFEMIPAGNLDQNSKINGSEIDFIKQLTIEFKEETFLSESEITRIEPFLLVYDKQKNIYDVCCKITINTEEERVRDCLAKSYEYDEFLILNFEDLTKFCKENTSQMIPTTLAMAHFLLNEQKGFS